MRRVVEPRTVYAADHPERAASFGGAVVAVWACGVLLAAPVVAFRYPPMGDLPFHESLVALLRRGGDEAMFPAGVYARSFGPPNQLFHLCAWLLSLVAPTDVACKLVVAAAILATPPAAARLARHLGVTAWSALLVAPLALGFAFRWGLVGNVVALPIVLAVLPALDAYAASPRPRGAAACAALAVLAYLAHESAMVVVAWASVVFAVRAPLDARRIGRLVPVGACGVLAAFYAWWGRHLKAPSILAVADAFGPIATRVRDVPGVLLGSRDAGATYAAFAAYAVAAAALVASRVWGPPREDAGAGGGEADPPRGVVARIERHRFALVAAGCLALYFVVPLAYGGATLLYPRFLAFAVGVGVVALAPRAQDRLRPAVVSLVCAAPAVWLATAAPGFVDAERRFDDLDAILPRIAENSAIAQLDLTPRRSGVVAPIPGAAARALAERGGRLLFSFTDAPTSPVIGVPRYQWNEPVLRMAQDPAAFVPAHDFRRFRYALVRLGPEGAPLAPRLPAIMAPEAKLVAASGEWILFESTLPVAPLASPDVPLAAPRSMSLRERIAELSARTGADPQPRPER